MARASAPRSCPDIFNPHAANVHSASLILSVAGLVIPALLLLCSPSIDATEKEIVSAVVAIVLIALYIGKQGLESTYGAAASIVVVLIWVYYSAQIVLFGAEFTNVVSKKKSARRKPRRHADGREPAAA